MLLTEPEAAALLQMPNSTLASRRHRGNGPPYVMTVVGSALYYQPDLERWAIVHDVADFLDYAIQYAESLPPAMSGEIDTEHMVTSVMDFLTAQMPPLADIVETIPPPLPRKKRPRKDRWSTFPPPLPTEPPPPPPPTAAAEEAVSVKGMGPSEAIPKMLETTHPEPLRYGELLEYLRSGGYEGSLSAIGPAINALKQKGILRLTDDKRWALVKEPQS